MDNFETGMIEVHEDTKRTANKVGYLIKRGAKWKNWKKRYFVLKDNFLFYFSEPQDTKPNGVILLDGTKIESAEKETKRKFCFSLKSKKSFTNTEEWQDRIYYCQAQSSEEMESWVNAITAASVGKLPQSQRLTEEAQRFFRACGKGDLAAVKSIYSPQKSELLSTLDDDGNSVLHWACVGGHVDVVSYLLEQGANIEIKSKDGFVPLHSVAQEDNYAVLELLITKGADVNAPNLDDNHNTTLHYAACWGAVECAKSLIKHGANVNARAHDQSTPLSFAAEKGHLAIANLLMDAGASLEAKNDAEEKGGATPFLLAAHNGQTQVVKMLLERGANVQETTIDGLNSVHLAIRSGSDNEELIRTLLEGGAQVNGKTVNGDTPLHYASYMGYTKAVSLLIEKGADLEAKGQNDSSPLHFAAREGQSEVIALLKQHGASLVSVDKDGDTPFQCAEINGHAKCAEMLKP